MKIADLASKLNAMKDAIGDARVLYVATTSTMDEMAQRVWDRGELTSGAVIKYKEDYEVYIYKPPFPRKGNGKGKHGAKIKGQWAPTYLAAKAAVGRPNTPFELTGDMRKDWLGGAVPSPKEVSPYKVVIEVRESTKKQIDGLTRHKGAFLKLSDAEKKQHALNVLHAYQELVLEQW